MHVTTQSALHSDAELGVPDGQASFVMRPVTGSYVGYRSHRAIICASVQPTEALKCQSLLTPPLY